MKLNWKKYPQVQPSRYGRYIIWAKCRRAGLCACPPYLDIVLYEPDRGWNISNRWVVTHWTEREDIEPPEGAEPLRELTAQDYHDLKQADYESMRETMRKDW